MFFVIALGRAPAPRENGGGVGLYATSPRCGRASLAVGFSLQSLTLAYACMPLTVAYIKYELSIVIQPVMHTAAGKKAHACTLMPVAQIATESPRHPRRSNGRGL